MGALTPAEAKDSDFSEQLVLILDALLRKQCPQTAQRLFGPTSTPQKPTSPQ
jgi:hypothetical protein